MDFVPQSSNLKTSKGLLTFKRTRTFIIGYHLLPRGGDYPNNFQTGFQQPPNYSQTTSNLPAKRTPSYHQSTSKLPPKLYSSKPPNYLQTTPKLHPKLPPHYGSTTPKTTSKLPCKLAPNYRPVHDKQAIQVGPHTYNNPVETL